MATNHDPQAHQRINALEQTVTVMRTELQIMKVAIDENTESTKEVVTNTSDMVDLLRGGKVATRMFLWLVSISAGITVILTAMALKK